MEVSLGPEIFNLKEIKKIGPPWVLAWDFSQIKVDALRIGHRNGGFKVTIYTSFHVIMMNSSSKDAVLSKLQTKSRLQEKHVCNSSQEKQEFTL